MTWYKPLGTTETIFILLFCFLYIAYIWRSIRIAKRLRAAYKWVFVKLVLRTIYFGCFIAALLGPSFGQMAQEIKSQGKDIMICVDLSRSMDATDIAPSRLEKVKFELKNLVKSFASDRVGVIIFSSEAFMQCPLTFDQSALNLFIETMNTSLVPHSGTDFGPPLQMALDKLKAQQDDNSSPKSKVIILISDGEDFGENTADAITQVEDQNIKLFSVGVGTEAGGRIPVGRGFKRQSNGQPVLTKLEASSLKKIASKTGGRYFEVNDQRNDVPKLINDISKIEGELRDTRKIDVKANKYFYFLAFGLLLMGIDVLTSIRTIKI
ncbi:vWA domain-containing protein [Persicobacter psychrovividus]|uniref:BatB protein n=1 Tax=Persicobacter psychrovividus TaxID=387638 RepID=A0ABN6L617_9BACT|nr:BatB protein [Persicobacter psychrovividus]